MIRTTAIAIALILGTTLPAAANGRSPATSTITFRQGQETDIVAGLTFGMIVSHDGGATWSWMCEQAIGYGGLFDPTYAYSQSGAIFATTFAGYVVNRDGCTFAATPPGTTLISTAVLAPDHALYIAASDIADSNIYKSTDDGMTFTLSATPGLVGDWWQSLVVAPSDPNRLYLSGYRYRPSLRPNTASELRTYQPVGKIKVLLLLESIDGGQTFSSRYTTGLSINPSSSLQIAGVSPTNPDVFYVRVTFADGNVGDGLYRTDDAGATWTQILAEPAGIAFVARANGDIVAATQNQGAWVSHDQGATWIALVGAPHMNCLVENSAGEVWACTANFASITGSSVPDGAGIMKTIDLASWTKVVRFQDISGPVACAAGTAQEAQCVASAMGMPSVWCCLENQIGITSTEIDCTHAPLSCNSAPAPDGAPVDGSLTRTSPPVTGGCCDAGGSSGGVLFGVLVGAYVVRGRRRRA